MVWRQLSEVGAFNWSLHGSCDNRRGWRFRWDNSLDDNGRAGLRRDQMEPLSSERFNALRRLQRFDFEAQVTIDLLLVAPLFLHLLDAITMLQELHPLPA